MTRLERRIGVPGAIAIGLGAMIGAGLFFVWPPAAHVAGEWLWLALLVAAGVAVLNALSSAQLAMEHPVSGGAYAYGRAEVSPAVGFAAGWMFLTGKTASAAAIAVIAGEHAWPGMGRWLGVAAVVVLVALNALGVRVTAWVSAGIVAVVVAVVVAVLVWAAAGGDAANTGGIANAPLSGTSMPAVTMPAVSTLFSGALPAPVAVLQAAGILFFAFAGYARMATLGEEVRHPRRTLPFAILAGLGVVLVLYGLLAWATTARLGDALVLSRTPVADLVAQPALHALALAAGVLACLGSLMGILAGLSRTGLAMARDGELPGPLSFVAARTGAPVVAEVVVALVAILGVLVLPAGALVAFSSTCVLTYYAVAHVAALRLTSRARRARASAGASAGSGAGASSGAQGEAPGCAQRAGHAVGAPCEAHSCTTLCEHDAVGAVRDAQPSAVRDRDRALGAAQSRTLWLPRAVPVLGLIACAAIVITLPPWGVLAASAWLALALAARTLHPRRARRPRHAPR